jgi:hypothetical protein
MSLSRLGAYVAVADEPKRFAYFIGSAPIRLARDVYAAVSILAGICEDSCALARVLSPAAQELVLDTLALACLFKRARGSAKAASSDLPCLSCKPESSQACQCRTCNKARTVRPCPPASLPACRCRLQVVAARPGGGGAGACKA